MRLEGRGPRTSLEQDDFGLYRHHQLRHCEPPGRRKAPPDDRLHEAIQDRKKDWIASSRSLSSGAHSRDLLAPRNDDQSDSTLTHHAPALLVQLFLGSAKQLAPLALVLSSQIG